MEADITFRIRTVDEDKELTISVPVNATFEDVAQQVGVPCYPCCCSSTSLGRVSTGLLWAYCRSGNRKGGGMTRLYVSCVGAGSCSPTKA